MNWREINHLLFMDDLQLYCECDKALDSLIQTIRIFSEDIEMQIGIDKCAMFLKKKGENSEVRWYSIAQ